MFLLNVMRCLSGSPDSNNNNALSGCLTTVRKSQSYSALRHLDHLCPFNLISSSPRRYCYYPPTQSIMAVKKSPRTPRTSTTAVKTDSTPRPTRSSGRNSTQTGGQNGRATTPDSSTEELKGSVSPYFSNTTKRSRPTPVQNKRKGNGKSSETPTKPTPSGRGKGKGKPPVKKPKLKKDPEDVTGMTDTEEESESGSEDGDTEDDFAPSDEDDEEEEVPESEDESEGSGDSDAFDDTPNRRKRKGAAAAKSKKSNKKTAATQSKSKKGGKHAPVDGYEDEVVDSDIELEEGQEIAGRIYPAPKTGQGESARSRVMFFWATEDYKCLLKQPLTSSSTRSDIPKHAQLFEEPPDSRAER